MRLRYLRFRYEILRLLFCKNTDGFESFELFARHFKKHGHRVGLTSDWRYLRRADALFGGIAFPANHSGAPLGALEECRRGYDLALLRYNNPTNELAIRHGNFIGTCFTDVRKSLRVYFLGECVA